MSAQSALARRPVGYQMLAALLSDAVIATDYQVKVKMGNIKT